MAEREAAIRITLNNGSFLSGMDGIVDKAKQVSGKVKAAFGTAFKGTGGAGWGAAGDSIKDMAGGLKDVMSTAATLGGGIGFGMLVKKASDLRGTLRDVEFSVNKTGQQTANWRDLMTDVQGATDATGRSSDELAGILSDMWEGGGDIDYAKKAIVPVGHAAQATGKDIKMLAGIATMLQEKFNATSDTLPQMLGAIIQKTNQGGLGLEAMGDKFGLLAGEAVDAGFAGAAGISNVVGMLNALDDRLGDKSIPSFKKLFQVLKDGSGSLAAIQKAGNIKLEGLTGAEKLRKIMGSDKARDAITAKLGGEQRVVFDLLANPFVEAAQKAKEGSAKAKDIQAAGMAAFDEAMKSMGESAMTFNDVIKQSKSKQEGDPQIKLNKAIEKISAKFTEPKMLDALDQLSDSLPKLANGMIKLLDFAVKHPLLAGGAVVGAKMTGAIGGAMLGQVGENLAGALKGALKSGGSSLVADLKNTMSQGAAGWGHLMGKSMGVAAGALIALEIGQAIIDARIKEKEDSQRKSIGAGIEAANAMGSKDPMQIAAARDKLMADYNRQREDYESFTTGGLDAFFNAGAKLVDSDYKAPELTQMENTVKQITELNAALTAMTEKAQAAAKGSEDMAQGTRKAGQAAGQAAQQLSNINGSTTSESTGNGVSKGPGGPGNKGTPGYAAGG